MRHLHWRELSADSQAFHLAFTEFRPREGAPVHTHDFAEVFWVEAGAGLHRVNGQTIRLSADDLVMIRPHDHHGIRPTGPAGIAFINLAFPARTVDALRDRYFCDQPDPWAADRALPRTLRLTVAQRHWLAAAGRQLGAAQRTPFARDRFLLNLLHELVLEEGADPFAACPDWLRSACLALREPERFRLGTRELARLCGRSPEHVARVLKRSTGRTPSAVLNAIRLDYAAAQLTTTGRDILDLALDCGFRSLSHFYRIFKVRFGLPPRQYRLRNRKGLVSPAK